MQTTSHLSQLTLESAHTTTNTITVNMYSRIKQTDLASHTPCDHTLMQVGNTSLACKPIPATHQVHAGSTYYTTYDYNVCVAYKSILMRLHFKVCCECACHI